MSRLSLSVLAGRRTPVGVRYDRSTGSIVVVSQQEYTGEIYPDRTLSSKVNGMIPFFGFVLIGATTSRIHIKDLLNFPHCSPVLLISVVTFFIEHTLPFQCCTPKYDVTEFVHPAVMICAFGMRRCWNSPSPGDVRVG